MKGKERAELRAEAHHLNPMIHIGHLGLSDTALGALDDALRTHELVKVALARTLEESPKALANQMAEALGADVIQVIGRKATLYRHNPDLWKEPRKLPPWKG
ncbi:MAG TPA: YhbY family RNA-binding protein [Gemmatimonadaceae bacterium]|nr:YhbY family RNA-binding protein [Gemmatimonadaceae bacterium]